MVHQVPPLWQGLGYEMAKTHTVSALPGRTGPSPHEYTVLGTSDSAGEVREEDTRLRSREKSDVAQKGDECVQGPLVRRPGDA